MSRRRFRSLLVAVCVVSSFAHASLTAPSASSTLIASASELDIGVSLFNQGKYSDAIQHLSAAQSVPALTPRALYYRALAELRLGRSVMGADTLRALVAVAPKSAEAQLAQRYLLSLEAPQQPEFNITPPHIKIPYVDGRDGWMHVQATINTNQIIDMVWDTGASNCSIPVNIYGHIPPNALTTSVETPQGKEGAYIARIPIELAGMKRFALTTLMNGPAVIGESFFRDYEVEVSKSDHIIYLDSVNFGGAASRPRPPEDPSPDQLAAAATMRGGGRHRIPVFVPPPPPPKRTFPLAFQRESGLILIDIIVDNRPVKAYFDTGCAAKGIAMTAAMAASARDQLFERDKQIEHQRIVDLTLGPIQRQAVKVTIANGLSRPLVGPAILGNRGYRIDPVRQVIDVDYAED